MRHWTSHLLMIAAVCAVVLFTNLGSSRLWDRDEPRNAGCAQEMMERGNLIVPVFNDELRAQKPVLLYWLMIGAYQIFGVSEFAARFWSAMLATGTVLATWAIARRLFNPSAALYAAIVLATSMMFVVAGRAATPDSVLIFCSTVALMFYVLGTFSPRKNPADAARMRWEGYYFPQDYRYVLAMYGMMGLGVLAKGPAGFLVPCAIIGMFMLIQRLPTQDNDTWNQRGWLARFVVSLVRP
ncbi:MAG: ArnT family glycosyltransferase, partial [Pirellulaceae bacterium]